ncbi:amidase [Acidibrevibacterium fodinaquatile]|uniref:amidase n=1 Tax=Acidibrevibacterium fodinaquatile TaxID=1969806 RepID=UPI000E0D0D34|nr:amidase [Acidibrevibacterium fodinaquatile]
MSDLADLTAVDLAAGFACGKFSPPEVLAAVEARIAACEPHLHALYAYDPEGARAAARASAARWARGAALGPLDGVPVTIKENVATKGVPMPLGTAASDLTPAAADAPPAARLREAGAVILGKTTMPDYGMLSSGLSSFHPLTRNPWNLARNPGGSSAGAAAAAAAGYGPLHLGTDIGGSVRLPAGWCGVVGLKPSLGRVPIDPPYIGRVAGPLTRTVADTALMMSILSRPDRRDHMSLPPADIPWQDLAISPKRLRLGLMLEAGFGFPVEPEVKAAVAGAAKRFAAEGAEIIEVAPFLTREMMAGLDMFWRVRAWADIKALPAARAAKVLPFIRAWAEGGANASGLDVYHGVSQIMAIRAAAMRAFDGVDYVLAPTAPMPAFAAELPAPSNDPERPFEHIGFTVAFNMSEQPAVSINAGYSAEGLPIGLQIIGQRFDDIGVLRVAALWEKLRPPSRAWPEVA